MTKYLLLGILVRLLVIPITYHPDLHFFVLANYLIVFKNLWFGFYDFLGSSSDSLAQVLPPHAFTFPPLAILSQGLFANIFYRFLSMDFIKSFLIHPNQYFNQLNFYLLITFTKLPYLIIDLLAGYFLAKIAIKKSPSDLDEKLRTNNFETVFILWMLNPITIYASFAIGQFDIYPTFATILTVYFAQKKQYYLSAVSLGFGGAFKLFPLLFLPLLLRYGKNLPQKLAIVSTGVLTYFITILPYLPSPGFRQYALLAPQTDKLLFAKIPLTGAEYLSIFIVGYFFIIYLAAHFKLSLWSSVTAILLLFFSVTHYHPQWFLWLSPWLILMFIRYPITKLPITLLLICYLIITLSFEPSLNWGIFIWNQNALPLTTFLPPFLELDKFKYLSIIRSLFAATGLYLAFRLISARSTKFPE